MELVKCVYCGEPLEDGDIRYDCDRDPCCEDCFYDRFGYCDDCGDVEDIDSLIPIHNRRGDVVSYACDSCAGHLYYLCIDCEQYFTRDAIALEDNENGEYICHDCHCAHDWVLCNDCGAIMRDYNANWNDTDDCYYCDSCAENHPEYNNIHEYGYKPYPDFYKTENDTENARYYGVELEIDDGDNADDCAGAMLELTEAIYCKHDGSLGDDGIEIVSQPCTLKYHMGQLPWDRIAETAGEYGYTSHDAGTCGLHIHVGRDELPDDAPEKLLALVDAVWDKLVVFSRRTERQLKSWANKPDAEITPDDDAETGKAKAEKHYSKGRYQAVNLRNGSTIEFRLFRGTLKMSTFKATLQLVDILCEYVTQNSLQDCAGATWKCVKAQGGNYPEFVNYCNERGI